MNLIAQIAAIYHKNLNRHPDAIKYLHSRGITDYSIDRFKIGYCDGNIGWRYGLSRDYPPEDLIKLPIFHKINDRIYDMFNNRITFPVISDNRIRHMTSRTLPGKRESKIKHLHQKGKILYAINHDILHYSDYVFITEGPIDCITLHQLKLPAIGLLGAHRITREIISDLIGKIVYIVFDTETNKAGEIASIRLAKKLVTYGIKSKIITLPAEENKVDINSYFKNHSIEEFRELIKSASLFNRNGSKPKQIKRDKCKIDIIQVASNYMEIIFTSGRYKATCPFHKETVPSLVFYPETNSFYCFGCGKYGTTNTILNHFKGV